MRRMRPAARSTRKPNMPPIRYAVVGLGHIAQTAVLPGMAHARGSRIAALVSDDPVKLKSLARRYKVEHAVNYEGYETLLASGEIDAVYLALPNDLHYQYTMRALHNGIHVLVEKPMAVTSAQCQEMIAAAEEADVKLMVAYRLHFERANLRAIAVTQKQRLGDLRFFHSTFSMQVTKGDIRTRATSTGGGPLYDLGIYCINAARGLFRAEPMAVSAFAARAADPRFTETDEMVSVLLRFPRERLAAFTASFGAADTAAYDLVGTLGSIRIDPAYEYREELCQHITIKGRTTIHRQPVGDQFAAEIDYFSRCIHDKRQPEPSGSEGLADVRVVEAIVEAARTGHAISLPPLEQPIQYPQPQLAMGYAASSEPPAIHAPKPHATP